MSQQHSNLLCATTVEDTPPHQWSGHTALLLLADPCPEWLLIITPSVLVHHLLQVLPWVCCVGRLDSKGVHQLLHGFWSQEGRQARAQPAAKQNPSADNSP
jgi:hypothetical protein